MRANIDKIVLDGHGSYLTKGFEYLRAKGGMLPSIYERTINDALDSTKFLVGNFKGVEDN
jgi:hypothetical protein